MDFAWVVDALRRGLKVTRTAWAGDPPMYLYMVAEKKPDGKHIIKMHTGTSHDFDWIPTAEQLLTVDDWEEYVEPKKVTSDKPTQRDLPVWPEVNADGYARMSKDSEAIVHDGVYRRKKESAEDKEDLIDYARGVVHCGEDTGYMAEQLEMLADIYAEKISQRVVQLLQKS